MDEFVGRGAELAALQGLLTDARDGRGGLVFVEGRGGLGKSRLVAEFSRAVSGARVAQGACLTGDIALPLWPWARALRHTDVVVELDAHASIDPQGALRRLADIADRVLLLAADEPLVVVLEDVHWSDGASIDLIRVLLPDLPATKLLVIATLRPVVSGSLADQVRMLRGQPGVTNLPLRPLRDEDARTFVRSRRPDLDDDAIAIISAAGGGNPLFLRWLADRTSDDRTTVRQDELALPPFLALGADARRFAAAAALAIEPPSIQVVAAVCDAEPTVVRAALQAAVTSGLLASLDPVVFAHELLQSPLRSLVEETEARHIHARYGTVLVEASGTERASAAAVAMHLVRSGDRDLMSAAATWARRAADEARSAGSWHEEAVLRRAADDALLQTPAGPRERADSAIDLAVALYRSGEIHDSVRAAGDAVRLAVDVGDLQLAARAATVVRGVDDSEVVEAVTEMTQRVLAEPGLSDELRARLVAADAAHRSTGLDAAGTLELGEHALALARTAEDPAAVLEACRLLITVPRPPEELGARLALADEASAAARATGDALATLWPLLWRLETLCGLGRRVDRVVDDMTALAQSCRLPLVQWHTCRARAALLAAAGRSAEASEMSRQADTLARQIGDMTAVGLGFAFRLHERMLRGEPVEPTPELEQIMLSLPPRIRPMIADQAYYYASTGRVSEARAALAALDDTFDTTVHDVHSIGMLAIVICAAAELGDTGVLRRARAALARSSLPDGGLGSGTLVIAGATAYYLGLADEGIGDRVAAVEQHRRGLSVNARMHLRLPSATSRLALARSLLAVGSPEAREEARGHVAAARQEFADLDAPQWHKDLDRLARALGDASGSGPLTPREQEVVDLVSRGLTNRQIAEELVLSERTVETHVRHVLDKLDLDRREDVIVWALRR